MERKGIILFFFMIIFIIGSFGFGYYIGADKAIHECSDVASKFINITLTEQGIKYIETYGVKAKVLGYIK